MASVNNIWVGYLDRSYQQVKAKLIDRLKTAAPEITDHTENNLFIVITSMFSGVAEMLNYYVDNMAREAFIDTARKYLSMIRLVRVLDYRVKANSAESVDVKFTLSDPAPAGGGVIPAGTSLSGSSVDFPFLTIENLTIAAGLTEGVTSAKQFASVTGANIGTTDGTKDQSFNLGPKYTEGTAAATINSIPYTRVDTFAYSLSTDTVFIVEIDANQEANIVFGDGVKGIIPPPSQIVYVDFQNTEGLNGSVGVGEIDTIDNPPTIPGVASIAVSNEIASSGGVGVESIGSIRKNAPLSIRTLYRAVTHQDYKDLAVMYQGVSKAEVEFCCGKTVDLYIAPEAGNEGGIATDSLLSEVELYFEPLRMVTTAVRALPAGLTELVLNMEVTPKFRRDPLQTKSDAENALIEGYGYLNSDINRPIRVSDLLALVDNLEKVDFTNIVELYLLPYARPLGHTVALDWDKLVLPTSDSIQEYQLTLSSTGSVIIARAGAFVAVVPQGTQYSDNWVQFTVNPSGLYTIGMVWEFTVYPHGVDIEVGDNSVPVLTIANLTIQTLTSQPTNNSNC